MSEAISGRIMYDEDEGYEAVRFFRKVKQQHVDDGHFRPGEDVEHVILHQKMAAIICQTTSGYDYCLEAFEKLVAGKPFVNFYAEYRIHPDDVEKATRNTAKALAEWDALVAAADESAEVAAADIQKARFHHKDTPCWKTVEKSIDNLKRFVPARAAA